MNCPVCDAQLRAIQRYGIEVDICPDCKGVWLDRGELEKIIEMESAGGPADMPSHSTGREQHLQEAQPRYRDEDRRRDHDHHDDDDRRRQPQYDQHGRAIRNKRESWLSQILEGFGGD